jgi:hypothetical protein
MLIRFIDKRRSFLKPALRGDETCENSIYFPETDRPALDAVLAEIETDAKK